MLDFDAERQALEEYEHAAFMTLVTGCKCRVTPSTLPLIPEVPDVRRYESPHLIDTLLDVIDMRGPLTCAELCDIVEVPYSTVRSSLYGSEGVERDDETKKWHLVDIPDDDPPAPVYVRVQEWLEVYGASTSRDITEALGMPRSSVCTVLRNRTDIFEVVGQNWNQGGARMYDLRCEGI